MYDSVSHQLLVALDVKQRREQHFFATVNHPLEVAPAPKLPEHPWSVVNKLDPEARDAAMKDWDRLMADYERAMEDYEARYAEWSRQCSEEKKRFEQWEKDLEPARKKLYRAYDWVSDLTAKIERRNSKSKCGPQPLCVGILTGTVLTSHFTRHQGSVWTTRHKHFSQTSNNKWWRFLNRQRSFTTCLKPHL